MDSSEMYFDFSDSSKRDAAITRIVQSFDKARNKADFPTNQGDFDEDVNLYISHLLFAISMPNYKNITEQYVSLNDSEVRVLVDMAEDKYLKYFIFKVNADNLLIRAGIYKDLVFQDKGLDKPLDAYYETAKEYYLQAAQLNKKIYRRKTAIADVLLKLSQDFALYVKSLHHMRKDFFVFLNRFEDNEFTNFMSSMKNYEHKLELEQKQNLFLDLYNMWLKNKDSALKTKINTLCDELHDLDPLFHFKIDE